MTTLAIELHIPNAQTVDVTDNTLTMDLNDGRTISAPFAWYPHLPFEIIKVFAILHALSLRRLVGLQGVVGTQRRVSWALTRKCPAVSLL
jgi:hypothetical protein